MSQTISLLRLCTYLALYKIAYLGLLSLLLLGRPIQKSDDMFPGAMLRITSTGALTFGSHFSTWDAEHYLILSDSGYRKGIAQCAFYPLWPFLIRWFSVLCGGNHVLAGMILANVLGILGSLLFFRLVSVKFGLAVAKPALVLLLAFPGALFFQFVYSESLFFFLLMLLCLGIQNKRSWLIAITAFLLPLTKAIGVFCIFPLFWRAMTLRVNHDKSKIKDRKAADSDAASSQEVVGAVHLARLVGLGRRLRVAGTSRRTFTAMELTLLPSLARDSKTSRQKISANLGDLLLVGVPICGWILYFALMRGWTGNAFEGFAAQQQWGNVETIENIANIPHFIAEFFCPTCWHGFTGSILDRCMFLLLVCCLASIWRLGRSWFLWAIVLGVIPAMSGTFVSFTRFESIVFPLFIALSIIAMSPGQRWLYWIMLITFISLQVVLLWRFVNFRWAG